MKKRMIAFLVLNVVLLLTIATQNVQACSLVICNATCINTDGSDGGTATCVATVFAASGACVCFTSSFGQMGECRANCNAITPSADVCAWI